jgi:hypothetical protein
LFLKKTTRNNSPVRVGGIDPQKKQHKTKHSWPGGETGMLKCMATGGDIRVGMPGNAYYSTKVLILEVILGKIPQIIPRLF